MGFLALFGLKHDSRAGLDKDGHCMPDKSRIRKQAVSSDVGEASRPATRKQLQVADLPASGPLNVAQQVPAAGGGQRVQQQQQQKRKQPDSSTSSDSDQEESADSAAGRRYRWQQQQQGRSSRQQQQQQPSALADAPKSAGLKRVRSTWKMRPLIIDEKLPVFVEGETDELLHYDGGEFYQWLKDCEAGRADPADGFPYPLLVQDQDLRTLLEIKPPEQQQAQRLEAGGTAPVAAAEAEAIVVPRMRVLPEAEQPDTLATTALPVVKRADELPGEQGAGPSAAAPAAAAPPLAAVAEPLDSDPPYIRYVQPTPDDLDLAVEYDLDEEDEEWLASFNSQAKHAKSRKGRRQLGEEWMEHLIDRMEKEYTAALQKHPEQWVVQRPEGGGPDDPPTILLPPIEEVFPLEACLQVPGINHYENVIEAVYCYWKEKHQREGRPLIQRLWYEPPWHQRKAAALADGGEDGEGPFLALDSPVALQNIRKRKLEPDEVQSRFAEMRRDLEALRTLADQLRRREKLKRRELQLYRDQWTMRLQALRDGAEDVAGIKGGKLRHPPAPLSTVARMTAAEEAEADSDVEGMSSEEGEGEALMHAIAEGRAVRLANRRTARDAAVLSTAMPAAARRRLVSSQQLQPQRRGMQHKRQAHGPTGQDGVVLKQAGNVRGPPPAPGVRRDTKCLWCGSDEFLMLGCSQCHRCFCFKCFQRRPGYGINNWSRAVKDANYQCVVCRGVERDDTSANTAVHLPADAADATATHPARPLVGAAARSHAARLAREAAAAAAATGQEDESREVDGAPPARRLVGAAARSHAARLAREAAAAAVAVESSEDESQHQQPVKRLVGVAARSHAGRLARKAAAAGDSSEEEHSSDEEEPDEPQPPARKLVGAAARSHAARLAREAADAAAAADSEEEQSETAQPKPARKLGGAAARSHAARLAREAAAAAAVAAESLGEESSEDESSEDESEHQQPVKRLVGAAARSHAARLAREAAEAAGAAAAHSEQQDDSESAEQKPARKLVGAAARSREARLAREAAEAAAAEAHLQALRRPLVGAAAASHAQRLAREAAEADEQGRARKERHGPPKNGYAPTSSSDDAEGNDKASTASESEQGPRPAAKENRAPQLPPKRARLMAVAAGHVPAPAARQPTTARGLHREAKSAHKVVKQRRIDGQQHARLAG